jgi:hypothetical protein
MNSEQSIISEGIEKTRIFRLFQTLNALLLVLLFFWQFYVEPKKRMVEDKIRIQQDQKSLAESQKLLQEEQTLFEKIKADPTSSPESTKRYRTTLDLFESSEQSSEKELQLSEAYLAKDRPFSFFQFTRN